MKIMPFVALGTIFALYFLRNRIPQPSPKVRLRTTPVDAPPPEPVDPSRVPARLAAHRRDAWFPRVAEGDAPGSSGFSGIAALRAGEPWPRCTHCGRPMQLFVQLRAADLPAEAAARVDGGVFQLFYCTDECGRPEEAGDGDGGAPIVRLLRADEPSADATELPPGMYPPRRITGWTRRDDYPDAEELESLDAAAGEEALDAASELDTPFAGDKLLGWPAWVQVMDYANCRRCGTRMEHLFQIESEGNLPHLFGDMGTCHVLQCPVHHGELALEYASS